MNTINSTPSSTSVTEVTTEFGDGFDVSLSIFESEGARQRVVLIEDTIGNAAGLTMEQAQAFASALSDKARELERITRAEDGTDAQTAEWVRAEEEAQATPCAFEECDGSWHSKQTPESEWMHKVWSGAFDCFESEIIIDPTRTPPAVANIYASADEDMPTLNIRADADLYASFPGWLRSVADRVDALNAEVAS